MLVGVVVLFAMTMASATSDSFCGEPSVDAASETGLYIWKDCQLVGSREQWYIKTTSGGSSTPLIYDGSVESSWRILGLQGINNSVEGSDVLSMPTIRTVDYSLRVINTGIDQIGFTIHTDSPTSTLLVDASQAIFAGPNKVAVTSPLSLDQDIASALPELSIDDVSADESDGELRFTISLSRAPGEGNSVTVDFETLNDTATFPSDFVRGQGSRTFTGSQLTKTVTVDLTDDCSNESTERFYLKLSNPVGATIAKDLGEGTTFDQDYYSNERLTNAGYVSVAQYNNQGTIGGQTAKPNDGIDDTVAIQAAIDDAVEGGLNVYFPAGEWQVSDTLYAVMRVDNDNGRWVQRDRRRSASIVGCSINRPIIKLVPSDNTFNNPSSNESRKPVLWVYAQARDANVRNSFTGSNDIIPGPVVGSRLADAMNHQGNISFNQVIKGIDFDLDASNTKGAIAIRHPGSQGSSISDVKADLGIDENASYAAFDNPPGQGGGLYNTEVNGGQYAVTTNRDVRFPVIVGARFIDQSNAAIRLENTENSMVVAGFYIKSRYPGANGVEMSRASSFANNISMADGKFRFDSAGSVAIKDLGSGLGERSIYLDNVYFDESISQYNVYKVIENEELGDVLREYGDHAPLPSLVARNYVYGGERAEILNNGVKTTGPNVAFGSISDHNGDSPSVDVLLAKHIWDSSFPNFQDHDAVNALEARDSTGRKYIENGAADVTAGLQRLIDDHQKIFLPIGDYNVTATIFLGKDTVLLGAGKTNTSIRATGNWPLGEPIIAIDPSLSAAQASEATTVLAHIMLRSQGGESNPTILRANSFIDWTAGSDSMVRDFMIGTDGYHGPVRSGERVTNKPAITIRDTGGGNWYGFMGEWTRLRYNTENDDYRGLLVENTRNSGQILNIYGLNIERSQSNPQSEFNNVANANIYSLKAEAQGSEPGDVLHIVDSTKVRVLGLTGNATPDENLIKVINSTDTSLLNIASVKPSANFNAVNEDDVSAVSGSKVGFLLRD